MGGARPVTERLTDFGEKDLVWESSAKPRFRSLVESGKVLLPIGAFVTMQTSRASMFLCCFRRQWPLKRGIGHSSRWSKNRSLSSEAMV
ncbi:hypothetical protein EUGRSUZ_E02594 [Eucalyptus grandis]|uniref:Uncharacterized protein n=2 Tax=Eucalyptus grandis TaxID=71139 RepID=A0ACC3KXM5_EUCGR|nr:hypothetical protein EUGRSUZ_E02594 [Eucalyptus grandis]